MAQPTTHGARKDEPRPQTDSAVMVTGGSGFIGQHLVRSLATKGRTVVSVYHHKLPESLDNVYPVCCDISSPELMAAPLRGVDTVVHLAWGGGLAGPSVPLVYNPAAPGGLTPNLQILQNVLRAMERAKTKRIVFLSAIGATRQAATPFLREKYLAEHFVLNSRVPEKVVIRSTVAWSDEGANDPFLRSIIRVMKYPIYPVPRKEGGLAPVHVQDLAETLASASQHPLQAPATVLDVHGAETYKVQDLFKLVSETFAKGAKIGLSGVIGESLLPLLERDRRSQPNGPRLAHYMAIGGAANDDTRRDNPFTAVIPHKLASFREKLHG